MEYNAKNVTIYYEIYGSGTPVLLIHGCKPDHRLMKGCMEPIFKNLNQPWQRIYFDMPGMGLTKAHPSIANSDQMLDLIQEFIDGIIPNRHFLIAGESYGGLMARGLIRKRPENIAGLLLICPVGETDPAKSEKPAFHVLEKNESLLGSLSKEDRQEFTSINVIQTQKVWERFNDEILPALKIADITALKKLWNNFPFSFNVDHLEQPFLKPTLMIMGRQDSVVGYRDIWKIIENYPRASFVILDKAGHNLQLEQENLFNELVKEWITRVLENGD